MSSQRATLSLILFCHPCKAVNNTFCCPLHLIGTITSPTKMMCLLQSGDERRAIKETTKRTSLSSWEVFKGTGNQERLHTNRRTSFSSWDVFKGTGNQGETTNRMPLSSWDVFKGTDDHPRGVT